MDFTYSFGYPNVQRTLAIAEAISNSHTGEKYQVDYRGKYRPLPVIEVPIELLVYRVENIRTKSLQKQWLAQHRDLPRDLFVSDPFSIEAQENQHQVLKLLVDKENLLKTFRDNDKLQQTEPLICSNDGVVVNGNRRLCAWRELYYNNKSKYAHFQTVRVAVLPDNDPQGMYDLEVALQMLTDYVLKCAPIWANRIPYGRREATIFMTKDERACFADAGLLSDHLDAGIIDWWDTIATHIRMQTKQSKIGTGRLGERNTIKYERSRTNVDPMWMSIDSNLLGYDIKSQVSKNDPGTLLIEVKASTFTLSRAEFYVTSNEWNVAITSGAYVFHLWCLSDGKKMLAILSPDEILPYIPTNNLDGQWETVKIPFLCFEDKFVEIA